MLELNLVRNQPEEVKQKLLQKNFKDTDLVDSIIALDEERRSTQQQLDQSLSEGNQIAKEIGLLFKEGKREEAEAKKQRASQLRTEGKELQETLNAKETELKNQLILLPNVPHDSVPAGNSDADNVLVKDGNRAVNISEQVLPHWELMEKYELMSLELGNKIAGSGFPVFMDRGAKLQRALVAFFLDEASKAGYKEYIPPLVVNEPTAFGTGQLPDKEGQMYHIEADGLYMIPTAEVPITNVYRDEILQADTLPIKMCGHSQCFRREAGSYGKDVRGLNRVHQFEKVEIVQIVHPDKSQQALDEMVAHVEGIVNKLELPYRIVRLCGGDLSFASHLTYDFEVYAAGQKRWLEVSSVSNFLTFQSNRMKVRFKDENKKNRLAHTLNGSALALPRIIASIIENNQTEEGIIIPEVLRPYTGFDIIAE